MAPPDLHRFTLDNGLRVVFAPDRTIPVVGVSVHYDVGFRSEPEGRTGFAHLFEHLMFQGSESLEKLAHFRHVQSSGGTFNGSTHPGLHRLLRGAARRPALERALFLEADRMRAPADHRGEPAQPDRRGEGGDPAQRAEPALRRVPVDPAARRCCTRRSRTRTTATATSPSWSGATSRTARRSSTPTTRRPTPC